MTPAKRRPLHYWLSRRVPVSPRFRVDPWTYFDYCSGAGGGGAGFVLRVVRGRAPAEPNENDRVSPGTLVKVTRLPIFLARSDTAGSGGGGLVGSGAVVSPNIIVTPV